MTIRKTNLQGHRLKAFSATLDQIETRLQQKIQFVEGYSDVYKFPKMITRRNLKQYKIWLKATQQLREMDQKHL